MKKRIGRPPFLGETTVTVTTRIPADLHEEINKRSAKELISTATFFRRALLNELKRYRRFGRE